MRSIIQATALLSGSAMIRIGLALLLGKAAALLLGPSGLGYMTLLQSLVGWGGIIAGFGVGATLTRFGSRLWAGRSTIELSQTVQAAWGILILGVGTIDLALLVWRHPIALGILGHSDESHDISWMTIVLTLSTLSVIPSSMLKATQNVKALAQMSLITALATTIFTLGCFWQWRRAGIVPAMILTSITLLSVSYGFARRHMAWKRPPWSWSALASPARALLKSGIPYAMSLLVGSGLQWTIPLFVLHRFGPSAVGLYAVTWAISSNYMGFLVTTLGQDYFPRLAAAAATSVPVIINRQLRLILLLAIPLISAVVVFAPLVVPLIYSNQFLPAVIIVQWMVTGDLCRFTTWTLAYAVLARLSSRTYLQMEAGNGVVSLAITLLGMQYFGWVGLGIGFLMAYISSMIMTGIYAYRRLGFRINVPNLQLLAGGSLLLAVLRALPAMLPPLVFPMGTVLVLLAGFYSGRQLRQEWRAQSASTSELAP